MLKSHIILAAGWVIFCLLHSILASSWFKDRVGKTAGRHYRLYYSLFAFVSFAGIMIYLFTLPSSRLFNRNIATIIAGGIISFTGLIIMSICIAKYFMRLSGIKGLLENKATSELMITGIHKNVRHPLYAGTFIFIWGLLLLYPYWSLLITNIIITGYTLIGIHFEEKKLIREFGDKYLLYKKQTPMLIPKLNQGIHK